MKNLLSLMPVFCFCLLPPSFLINCSKTYIKYKFVQIFLMGVEMIPSPWFTPNMRYMAVPYSLQMSLYCIRCLLSHVNVQCGSEGVNAADDWLELIMSLKSEK